MPGIPGIIFDLYGTLVRIGDPVIHKAIPRALGVPARPWIELVRNRLLTSSFAGVSEFVTAICDALLAAGPNGHRPTVDRDTAMARCTALVERELASVERCEGVLPYLRFLRRRGHRLGLVSNLTSVHRDAIRTLDIEEQFDAVAFSCEEDLCKPDRRIFLDLCRRLEVEPGDALMVGDSLHNDVKAARDVGMRAVRVGGPPPREGVAEVRDLAWSVVDGDGVRRPLVGGGGRVSLAGSEVELDDPSCLPDDEQGRYNLVGVARGRRRAGPAPSETKLYCKRFRHPETAHVEAFAREVLEMAGLPSCAATVTEGAEPCLVMARAPGSKLEGRVDADLARELGRHCAVGYVFANADLRSRNAFVRRGTEGPAVTMLDLEHMFFNLALETDGLEDPFHPDTFDRLSEEELERRLRRRVLTERTTRRAMRSFVEPESAESERGRAFRSGWISAYRHVQSKVDPICRRIDDRVHTRPFLIIGTSSYRRAMATIDVEDIRKRILRDPEALFPRLAALKDRG